MLLLAIGALIGIFGMVFLYLFVVEYDRQMLDAAHDVYSSSREVCPYEQD